jgi:hypothetical protein
MTPEEATEKQIEMYRQMTGEQRLQIALNLHELACGLAREGIRSQYPDADETEVAERLRERIRLAQGL